MPKYQPKHTKETIHTEETMEASKAKEGGPVGLNYPMLTRSNYTAWSLKMKVFMKAQGVWGAIEQTDPEATVEDRTVQVALAAIYQGVPEDVLLTIAEKETAKEAWEMIKTMCMGAEKVKEAKVQTLKGEFESLIMKETDKIDDFCMKLSGLVANIRILGETMEESNVVRKILRAVPDKFLQIASNIEQFGNVKDMTVEEVVGRLKAHEERMKGRSEGAGGHLLFTQEEWSKRSNKNGGSNSFGSKGRGNGLYRGRGRTSYRGGGTGRGYQNRNEDANKGSPASRNRSQVKCFNCGVYGHYANECRKPKKEKGRTQDQSQEVNLSQTSQTLDEEPALLLAECEVKDPKVLLLNEDGVCPKLSLNEDRGEISNLWYLDNGASNHMTGKKSKFRELDESVTGRVKFGDGSMVKIEGKGTVAFRCKNGEERLLSEVYYIPSLHNNIISLGQMSECGNRVVLLGDYLWIYDKCDKLLMKVKRSSNRLYRIVIEEGTTTCLLSKVEEESWLWHARLGHVNFDAMKLMSANGMARGIPVFTRPKEICSGCLLSKQTRSPFPSKANFLAKEKLELVHSDICGPISPPTPAGNRYFILFIDDFSRNMWVYMLKQKSEALGAFKRFKVLAENEAQTTIKVLRTDRGGEFTSNEFQSFCEEAGIVRHLTAPYSPQQNGVVERRNRTVAAMTRSLLKEKGMPAMFWGEAVRHSIYILNRVPTKVLKGETPYEAWKGKKPDLSFIRVFGCLVYVKVPKEMVQKLDDRSTKMVYLGKEPGSKAHRMYNPSTGRLSVSRDVVFEEKKGWNWDSGKEESTTTHNSFVIVGMPEGVQSDQGYTSDNSVHSNTQESGQQYTSDSEESAASSASSEPRNFRRLSDVYRETDVVELDDDMLLLGIEEPASFEQAIKDSEWIKAMKTEMDAVENNKTWVLTDLPPGRKAISLKWVYKLKKNTDGEIVKYKARIVARGYVQKKGIDYEEVFAPVTRLETVRLLLALAAKNGWEVHHLDVKSAFLNGELLEEVYVSQPVGFVQENQRHKVYKLLKALYGLKQAPRAWYARLNKCLKNLGFTKCPHEHAVYTKRKGNEFLIVAVYVDDLLVTGSSMENVNKFKKEMNKEFEMTDMGKLSYYLGIEVNQGRNGTELKQSAYARKLLLKFDMAECNAVKYPMEPKEVLNKDAKGKAVDETKYRSIIGGLRYLVNTRPDLAYSVGVVSRYMERPTTMHYNATKRILRYIKGTVNHGLVYSRGVGNYILSGYSDSNMAGDTDDRKSTGGVAFYLNDNLITWISQKQKCVALSTCEAEFMAANAAACQGVWLRNLLRQITDIGDAPVVIFIDNKSAIDLTKNPVFHGRSKHIDVRYHFIRDCIERGEITVKHVCTTEQRADILTKAMARKKFEEMRTSLGIKDLAAQV